MRFGLVVASLVALAAAAPIDVSEIAGDVKYLKYTDYDPYSSYSPYAGYGRYASAADEEAAKMQTKPSNTKRDVPAQAGYGTYHYDDYDGYDPYSGYGHYDEAKAEHASTETKRDKQGYGDYSPYTDYGVYHGSVDAAAAKTQNDHEKRTQQADNSHYDQYSNYEPYASYDPYSSYSGAAEVEAAKTQNEKRDMVMHDKDFGMVAKRSMDHPDAAEVAGSAESHADGTLPNNWYGKYDPYKDYDKYGSYDDYAE